MAITKVTSGLISADASSIDLNIDAGTLYLDVSENRVGIGTISPLSKLDVAGNVRISDGVLEFDKPSVFGFRFLQNDAGNDLSIQQGDANNANYVTRLNIGSSGNVGIGTTSPSSYYATELVVDASDEGGISVVNGTTEAGYLAFADGTSGTARYSGYLSYDHNVDALTSRSAGYINFMTGGGTERMRIDASGNVGIGTTPLSKLHVFSSTPTSTPKDSNAVALFDDTEGRIQVRATNSGSDGAVVGLSTGSHNWGLMATAAGTFSNAFAIGYADTSTDGNVFGIDTISEKLIITTVGNVLVGTTTSSGLLSLYNSGQTGLNINTPTGTNTFAAFQRNGSTVGSITTNGSTTSFNTSSDYRLKENVDYEFNALDRVAQLKPARFNFIVDADRTVDGFLAHEVQDIVPEAITGEKDGVREEEYEITPAVLDDDGNVVTEAVMGTREVPEYQGIDQSKLVPLLTKAIQELSDKVDNQQTIIDNLTTRIETLENA